MSSLKYAQGTPEYIEDIPLSVLKPFQDLNCYPEAEHVEDALKSYYAKPATATTLSTSTKTSGKGSGKTP